MKVIGLSEYGGPEVLRPFELPHRNTGGAGTGPRRRCEPRRRDAPLRAAAADVPREDAPVRPGMEVAGTIEEVGGGVNPRWGLVAGAYVVGVRGQSGQPAAVTANISPFPAGPISGPGPHRRVQRRGGRLNNALTARNVLDAFRLPGAALPGHRRGRFGRWLPGRTRCRRGPARSSRRGRGRRGPVPLTRRADAGARRPRHRRARTEGTRVRWTRWRTRPCCTNRSLPAVRDSGQIGILRSWDGDPGRSITVKHQRAGTGRDRDATVRLRDQAEDGTITLRPALPFDADDAGAAHIRLEQGALRERIVLTFDHGN
ncbi:NADPH:quinone reductase-like Zn-dependent oxidoreductase OS=Streptomyces violarus OX=67380 GN=FHS41_000169 PE=4 SV=1 [Streptomyces violarus]